MDAKTYRDCPKKPIDSDDVTGSNDSTGDLSEASGGVRRTVMMLLAEMTLRGTCPKPDKNISSIK